MSEKKNYRQFCNRECEFFPCHEGADEENFSCLFCYCPLFPLGKECGGDFTYNKQGIKDCSKCTMPHDPGNYDRMIEGCNKVCKTFTNKKKERRIRLIVCLVLALLIGLVTMLVPVGIIQNLWRIPEAMSAPDITQVLAQLKDAAIIPAFLPGSVCALITFLISMRLHRHKLTAALLIFMVLAGSILAALLLTVVNGVPMYTMLKILIEYLRLGAF